MSNAGTIEQNLQSIRREIPEDVTVVAAGKTRDADDLSRAIDAGVSIVGENYVQEARRVQRNLGDRAKDVSWHMIGHLQTNKINKALRLFDLIQTVDSLKVARGISKRVEETYPVYVQVNIGEEESKYGVMPDDAVEVIEQVGGMENLLVEGLMTMEPYFEDPEKARPYFRRMRELYDRLQDDPPPGVELKVLSMGMTNSYRVAVEEGANMVRIGTAIFGPR
ncbi:MAG: YggS family pyridoxal phosphate-dependent enzyme [Planctomycetota bacterium]